MSFRLSTDSTPSMRAEPKSRPQPARAAGCTMSRTAASCSQSGAAAEPPEETEAAATEAAGEGMMRSAARPCPAATSPSFSCSVSTRSRRRPQPPPGKKTDACRSAAAW